jgi:hypothetical protein
MTLGVAYMWLKMYREAFEHFYGIARTTPKTSIANPRRSAGVFGMAGAAKWCLDETDVAVSQWRAGLDADYADAAGGVRLPMLLFTTAVMMPATFPRAAAVGILEERARDPRIGAWPGPLARFVVGQFDERGLAEHLTGINENDTALRHWQAGFYKGILDLARGNRYGFVDAMLTCVHSAVDGARTERFFTRCLWHEEFFIARHVVASKPMA